MPPSNGSAFIDPTPMLVQLAAGKPGVPPLQLTVWPDWRGAPNDGAALTSVLVLAVVSAHQTIATLANRVAALEVAITEGERLRHAVPDALTPDERARAHARRDMALAAIASVADQIEITATPAGILTDDRVGPPLGGNVLDEIDLARDTSAPVDGGVAGAVDDGGD